MHNIVQCTHMNLGSCITKVDSLAINVAFKKSDGRKHI